MSQAMIQITPEKDLKNLNGRVIANIEIVTSPHVENINTILIQFTDGTAIRINGNYGEGLNAQYLFESFGEHKI